jgi:hypothetical protein
MQTAQNTITAQFADTKEALMEDTSRNGSLRTLTTAADRWGGQTLAFGSAIISELLGEASARKLDVMVSVLKANPAARSLYERLGFVVTEESTHHHHMRLAP